MNPISPEELQALVAGYVLGDLNAEEAEVFGQLQRSPRTANEVATLIEQTQQAIDVAYFPEAVAPAPELRQRLLENWTAQTPELDQLALSSQSVLSSRSTSNQLHAGPNRTTPNTTIRQLPRWAKVTGILAISTILGLIASNYALWRSQQLQRQPIVLEQPDPTLRLELEPTETLTQTGVTSAVVKVSVALDVQQLRGTLTVEALPPPPPGRVYVLWTVLNSSTPVTTDSKGAILTSIFETDSVARQQKSFLLPPVFQLMPEAVEAIAITLEDGTVPQAHESAPLFKQLL